VIKEFKYPIVLYMRNGYKIRFYDFMAFYIFSEIFLEKCYNEHLIQIDAPVIIDIGANVGLFMLDKKIKCPDAQIICYEPYKKNFIHLEELVDLNNITGVIIHNQAVLKEKKRTKLYIHPTNSGGHSVYEGVAGKKHVEVMSVSITDIFHDNNINRCNLIKMDCEGAEMEIVKSITPDVAINIDAMIIEPSWKIYSTDKLVKVLEKLHYKTEIINGIVFAINKLVSLRPPG
jgi:FkbM family methyltransferase